MVEQKLICEACGKSFGSKASIMNHIFHRNLKNPEHLALRLKIKEERIHSAKLECPVCKQKIRRTIGNHFRFHQDDPHKTFIEMQKIYLINKLNEGYWISKMKKLESIFTNNFSYKYIFNLLRISLGKEILLKYSKKFFAERRKEILRSMSVNDLKKMMENARNAEWGNLTEEQRKNHPWVIAGRRSSLASTKKGSENQKLAYRLLNKEFPEFNWIYNYTFDDNWQVDIASPEKKIFIEWDGRVHRIPIYGEGNLNNRKNRDKLKNKIVVEDLQGLLIRVKDEGRKNANFVKNKVEHIKHLISLFLNNKEVIYI